MRIRQAQFDPELKDGQNAFEVITEEADIPSHQEYRHSTLIKGVKTGAELPCTVTELELLDDGVHTIIIDAERIIAFDVSYLLFIKLLAIMAFVTDSIIFIVGFRR